jgi:hypothetical protein
MLRLFLDFQILLVISHFCSCSSGDASPGKRFLVLFCIWFGFGVLSFEFILYVFIRHAAWRCSAVHHSVAYLMDVSGCGF